MKRSNKSWLLIGGLAMAVAIVGCDDEKNSPGSTVDLDRTYVQIERLGNPLVSEVFFPKRDHGFHNATAPATDRANFKTLLESFVSGPGSVAQRPAGVATTLSTVLLPDMLIVDTTKPTSSAGWLSWALASGYGGRKLTDDVVDAGLAAVFGSLLSADNQTPALVSDNVSANDATFSSTFPYLAAPH